MHRTFAILTFCCIGWASGAAAADYASLSGEAYPRERIVRIIDGRYIIGAHGTRVMPVWGEDLAHLEIGNPDAERSAQTIIGRLADYLGGLQRRPQ